MSIVSVNNISKSYNTNLLFENISFEINQQDVIALIGPNGAGKSTLLKIILGLEKASSGSVAYYGDKSLKYFYNRIAYVPQRVDFDKTTPFTVRELFRYQTKNITEAQIDYSLKDLDVLSIKNTKIGLLSGGEFQRILLALALSKEPEVIFLDEPSANVDIEGQKSFYEILTHINKSHKTAIFLISHDIQFVHSFAKSVLCLNKKLVCNADVATISTETLRLTFGEEVSMHQGHNH